MALQTRPHLTTSACKSLLLLHEANPAEGRGVEDGFKLAELKTEAVVGRQFTDKCIANFIKGELDAVDAAMAKMWLSNLHCKVVDECLQLFGGWGYMWEYPIARVYADARVVKIVGGSIEIMKHIIGRQLFKNHLPSAVGRRGTNTD